MANAKATTTRKSNVAMVYNPARKLTVGGASRTANPVKKRKKTTRRSNPAPKKVVNASSHRRRPRRSNPSTILGLFAAALVAGIGVSLFDILTARFLPQSGAIMRMGVKAGGAYLFQSNFGNKIPILGKYKNEIALVLLVSAVVDGFQIWVSPILNQVTGGYLMPPRTVQMVAAGGEMGDDYYIIDEYEDETGDDGEEEYEDDIL